MITSRGARRAAARPARPAGRRRPGWTGPVGRVASKGRVATAAVAVAVVAAGCATVPTSGAVQQFGGTGPASGPMPPQNYPQPIAVGPGLGWTPAEIVSGFIAASASFADNHAAARQYLDPAAQRSWQPAGWAVNVLSGMKTNPVVPLPRQLVTSQAGQSTMVNVTGLPVATLTNTGEYLVSSALPRPPVHFSLVKINGQWRIDALPSSQLLLTQADFQRVYQPRNLYFLAPSGRTLVPDPVFAPAEATNAELATGLVNALLQDPKGWLHGAAVTGFPANTSLIVPVKINGPIATVDLGGGAATADPRQQQQMAAQLAWTLTSGPTAIQSVELEVNGHPLQIAGSQLQLPQTYPSWVPTSSAGSSLYFISSNGTVRALPGDGQPGPGQAGGSVVPGVAGTADVPPLHSIAVSPAGSSIAGISANSKAVYVGELSHDATLSEWHTESGDCTSLSWDPQGDLWITAGGSLWMLPPGGHSAVPVTLPPGEQVSAFRVAPDGVRAAMIVNSAQVQLAAITHSGPLTVSLGEVMTIGGTDISDPEALSWYDANNVIVLTGSTSGNPLEEVPLNGGQPIPIAAEGNIMSVTALSPGGSSPDVAIGLADGQIMVSANLGAFASTGATGQAPVYPG